MKYRARDGRQIAESRDDHRRDRESHAARDALYRDAARPPRDTDGIDEAIETVHEQHHVGGLGGCRRAARAHGDAHVGRRQRRRVVDAVADHDDHALGSRRLDRMQLVGRRLLGLDLRDAEQRADRFRNIASIAGQHDEPADSLALEQPQRPGRLQPQLIRHAYRADHDAVHGDKDGRSFLVGHIAEKALAPRPCRCMRTNVGKAADRDRAAVHRARQAGSGRFLDGYGREQSDIALARRDRQRLRNEVA